MMDIPYLKCVATLTLLLYGAGSATAREAWADTNLSVLDGLELWYDATTLPAALKAQNQTALSFGEAVMTWPDGSGRGRTLSAVGDSTAPLWRDDLTLPT